MATIARTEAGTWKAQVRRVGLPAVSKTFKTKGDAEVWSRSVESEQDKGVFVNRSEADRVSIGELIDRYIQEVTPLKRSSKNDTQRLLFLKRHFGHYSASQLQSKHIAAYRDSRIAAGKQGSTVVKELGSLRHLLDVSIKDWGVPLATNVATMVRKPKEARGRDRRLRAGEESVLLEACRHSKSSLLTPLVILALESGMRLGELLSLEWGNIDLHRQTAYLSITKNGESRLVPLSKKAVETLRSIPRHIQDPRVFYAWSRADSFEHLWSRTVDRVGIEDLRFHDLRHEATSRLFEKGLNMMEVASITGHKTLQMLKRYTHLKAEDLVSKLG